MPRPHQRQSQRHCCSAAPRPQLTPAATLAYGVLAQVSMHTSELRWALILYLGAWVLVLAHYLRLRSVLPPPARCDSEHQGQYPRGPGSLMRPSLDGTVGPLPYFWCTEQRPRLTALGVQILVPAKCHTASRRTSTWTAQAFYRLNTPVRLQAGATLLCPALPRNCGYSFATGTNTNLLAGPRALVTQRVMQAFCILAATVHW